MRICILTRGDLFPPHHGAAVKIVRTAHGLAASTGEPVAVVTDDRDHWLRFHPHRVEQVAYTPRVRAAEEWAPCPAWAAGQRRWLAGWATRPKRPSSIDRSSTPRGGFGPSRAAHTGQHLPSRIPRVRRTRRSRRPGGNPRTTIRSQAGRPRSVIVQHNVEWDRLAEFGHTASGIRHAELAALAPSTTSSQ